MWIRLAFVLALGFVSVLRPDPVMAQSFAGCTPLQSRIAEQAILRAHDLTLRATGAVGNTQTYARWFGTYSRSNAETVRATLKAVVAALRADRFTAVCQDVLPDGCEEAQFAYVYPHEDDTIYLCPDFFTLPGLETLRIGAPDSDYGTREGTIIHEVSHFLTVADTHDHCYSRTECADMAARSARQAIENADSYQYFTEDVTFFARQPIAGKPQTAPTE